LRKFEIEGDLEQTRNEELVIEIGE